MHNLADATGTIKVTERKDDRLWGGRFERAPNAGFDAFQGSFAFDRRLLPHELAVDRAWAKALQGVGILNAEEVRQTLAALDRIAVRAQKDKAWLDTSDAEDVHHFVEKALVEQLGALGWKLHTGRSRNELVATDFRLFVKEAAAQIKMAVAELAAAFVTLAKSNLHLPMAGMTHMQHAQPILLSHFLLAHAEAFLRDIPRLGSATSSADACPMGSGALAGCSFPIDRDAIAREPQNPVHLAAQIALARLMLARDDIAAARAIVDAMLQTKPVDDDVVAVRGQLSLKEQNPGAAVQDFLSIAAHQPANAAVYTLLAEAYLQNPFQAPITGIVTPEKTERCWQI